MLNMIARAVGRPRTSREIFEKTLILSKHLNGVSEELNEQEQWLSLTDF